jgi:hypothetical protein
MYPTVLGLSSCCVSVDGSVYALVWPMVMGRSPFVLSVPVCGHIYALVYPIGLGPSSCCVMSVSGSIRWCVP